MYDILNAKATFISALTARGYRLPDDVNVRCRYNNEFVVEWHDKYRGREYVYSFIFIRQNVFGGYVYVSVGYRNSVNNHNCGRNIDDLCYYSVLCEDGSYSHDLFGFVPDRLLFDVNGRAVENPSFDDFGHYIQFDKYTVDEVLYG